MTCCPQISYMSPKKTHTYTSCFPGACFFLTAVLGVSSEQLPCLFDDLMAVLENVFYKVDTGVEDKVRTYITTSISIYPTPKRNRNMLLITNNLQVLQLYHTSSFPGTCFFLTSALGVSSEQFPSLFDDLTAALETVFFYTVDRNMRTHTTVHYPKPKGN